MNYPLISEYIEAIKSPEENFDKLRHLRPVLDADGNPFMSSGNFAVVFKMTDEEKCYAVKCFIKEQKNRKRRYSIVSNYLKSINSEYFVNIQYFEDELFVDTTQSTQTTYDVLLMDWVDGLSLDAFMQYRASGGHDCRAKENRFIYLDLLIQNFNSFIQWMTRQKIAHGDLKPDNIIITDDCKIRLVDYDNLYIPSMGIELLNDICYTPDYTNPSKKNVHNEHVDDFAMVIIVLSFLGKKYAKRYKPLLSADCLNLHNCECFCQLTTFINHNEVNFYLSKLFLLLYTDYVLAYECVFPDCTAQFFDNGSYVNLNIDKYGVIYTDNYNTLQIYPSWIKTECYQVDSRCEIIAAISFEFEVDPDPEFGVFYYGNDSLKELILPHGLKKIGSYALYGCHNLVNINLPESLEEIGNDALGNCNKIKALKFPTMLKKLGKRNIPKSIESLSSNSESVSVVSVQNEGKYIYTEMGELLWVEKSFRNFIIPQQITHICEYALGWTQIERLIIPQTIKKIDDNFIWGSNVRYLEFRGKDTSLGDQSLQLEPIWGRKYIEGTRSLSSIVVPEGAEYYYLRQKACQNTKIIEKDVLFDTDPLSYKLRKKWIDEYGAVYTYDKKILISLKIDTKNPKLNDYTYKINDQCVIICNNALSYNSKLYGVIMPEGLLAIGSHAFSNCYDLKKVVFPQSLKYIGDFAFCSTKIQNIVLSRDLKFIGINPFAETDLKVIRSNAPHYMCLMGMVYDVIRKEIVCCGTTQSELIIPYGCEF